MSGPRKRRGHEGAVVALLAVVVATPAAAYLIWDLSRAGRVSLQRPWALLLLLAVPLAFWALLLVRGPRRATLDYSSVGLLSRMRRGVVARVSSLPSILRVVALALVVVALARPQTRDRGNRVEVDGIDIVVALDLSRSMNATDLAPNRLSAALRVLDDFISRRRSDRIGIVLFAKEAFTHSPLTLDYGVLRSMLSDVRIGLIDGTATAIGNALGLSLARLRKSDAKSRVVILLTDGDNNAGNVTPSQAARYAQAMKVKVFTILMGPSADQPIAAGRDILGRPIQVQRQYPVNPKLLDGIAAQTGGKAYRATDSRALEENFEQILDELDKSTRRDIAAVYNDAYRPFAALALAFLLFEILLGLTRFRQFP